MHCECHCHFSLSIIYTKMHCKCHCHFCHILSNSGRFGHQCSFVRSLKFGLLFLRFPFGASGRRVWRVRAFTTRGPHPIRPLCRSGPVSLRFRGLSNVAGRPGSNRRISRANPDSVNEQLHSSSQNPPLPGIEYSESGE